MVTQRPAGVVATGVIQILGSVFMLLMSAFLFLGPVISRRVPQPKPPVPAAFFYGLAIFYGFLAVFGLLTAIGLLRLKSWARYATLVISPFPIVVGISVAASSFLVPLALPPEDPKATAAMATVRLVMAAIGLCLSGVGAFWLYYFNRATTKLAFAQAAGEISPSAGVQIAGRRVPFSIVVIAALALFSCLSFLPSLFFNSPAIYLGLTFRGAAGKFIFVLLTLLQIYTGVALLRLKNAGRMLSIALHSFWLLNSAILLFMPSGKLDRLMAQIPRWAEVQTATRYRPDIHSIGLMIRGGSMLGMVASAVILYFLVTRGWAFRDDAAA